MASTLTGRGAIALALGNLAERLSYETFALTHERLLAGAIGFPLGMAIAFIDSRISLTRKALEREDLHVALLSPPLFLSTTVLFVGLFIKRADQSHLSSTKFDVALMAIFGGLCFMTALIGFVEKRSLYATLFRFR